MAGRQTNYLGDSKMDIALVKKEGEHFLGDEKTKTGTIKSEIFAAEFKKSLQENFEPEEFNKWFANIIISDDKSSELILSAPSKFVRDWILREFVENKKSKNNLLKLAKKIDDKFKKVSVITPSTKINASFKSRIGDFNSEDKVVNLSKYNNVFNYGTDLNQRFTFENFVSVKYNKFALSMAKIAAKLEKSQLDFFEDNIPLFIHGGVGMGKTHLAQAVAWKIKEEDSSKRVVYLSAEKFMYHFVQSVRSNNMMNFKEQFRSVDVLIIDDVQFIAGKKSTQEEFMHSFNHLIENNKQVILVCDRSPSDLESVDEKLKSRISGGMVVNFKSPDFSDRVEILKSKVKNNNVEIDDKIIEFIASKIKNSVRDLDGAIRKLIANNIFGGEEINLESAKSVISEYVDLNKNNSISIKKIQKIVADYYGVKTSMLSQANRQKDIAKARQIAMYLAKETTTESLPKIGKSFNKNHATVIYSVKSIQKKISEDSAFSKEIKSIEEKLQ